MANEWNRLGTRRRVSPTFSLVWMAFLLGGSGLRYSATPQPDLTDIEVTTRVMRYSLWGVIVADFGAIIC